MRLLHLFLLAVVATLVANTAFAGGGSGNVTVVQQGNKLVITGDDMRNHIDITQANPDEFTVTGSGLTTVNGGAFATFGGVTGNLVIEMGDGGDAVDLVDSAGPVSVGGSVIVKQESTTGLTDSLLILGVTVGKDVKIDGAKSRRISVVMSDASEVVGNVQIKGGPEGLFFTSEELVVGKNLKFSGKPAVEEIFVLAGEVTGNLQIKTGAPESTIGIEGVAIGGKFDPGKAPKDTTRTVATYGFAS